MTRARSFIVACHLSIASLLVGTLVVAPTAVQAAADAKARKVSSRLAKPLKAAQEAIQKQQWDDALKHIADADAFEKKTPFDQYQIDEFKSFVLIQQKNYGDAAPLYERMLTSGFTPAENEDDRMKTVAQLYSTVKDYGKTAEWTRKWLERNPGDETMTLLLAQVSYLQNDFQTAADVSSKMISDAEAAGAVPREDVIEILLSSKVKTNDQPGIVDALKKSVRYHPNGERTAERWENLVDIFARKAQGDRMNLGFYRLMNDVGILSRAGDIMEMARLAIDAGVPGEAELVLQKVQGENPDKERYDSLVAQAKKLSAADKASLGQLAKEAEKATRGQADVALGEAYLSYGQYDEAIAAIKRGISKQGVLDIDETNISLGIAYMKNGDIEQARTAFESIRSDSKWADLAELWVLRTHSA